MPLISTSPYSIVDTSFTFDNVSYVQEFNVSGETTGARGLFFKPDGTKFYICGNGIAGIAEYDMSSAWNISTASHLQTYTTFTQEAGMVGCAFRPDGLKMYLSGTTNDRVYEYNLGTAWNVSTATFLQDASVATNSLNPADLYFKPDGTKMYIADANSDRIGEYDIGGGSPLTGSPLGAWNISTLSHLQSFDPPQESAPLGVFISPDGGKMFISGDQFALVHEYNLSTTWDISSNTYVQGFNAAAQTSTPYGVFFKPDGTKMFITGFSERKVFEYNLT